MIRGVEHIALYAEDLSSLVAWYRRIFPVDLIREGDTGPCFLKFPDGSLVEFVQAEGDVPDVPGEKEKGFRHLALTVVSLEEMVRTLKEEGVEVVEDLKAVPGGKLFLFRDIEGNLIQLVERKVPLVPDRDIPI